MTSFSKLTQNFSGPTINAIAKSTAKNLIIGCSITTLLQVFSQIQKLFGMKNSKDKTKEKSFDFKKFLISVLQSGSFLSSWTLLHQILIRIFESNLERPKAISLIASGTISGSVSMYFTQGLIKMIKFNIIKKDYHGNRLFIFYIVHYLVFIE